jgi:iron complex outermembrane recepter protein
MRFVPAQSALVAVLIAASPVRAQHATDDPVAAAGDAFGLTLGLESIGLY